MESFIRPVLIGISILVTGYMITNLNVSLQYGLAAQAVMAYIRGKW